MVCHLVCSDFRGNFSSVLFGLQLTVCQYKVSGFFCVWDYEFQRATISDHIRIRKSFVQLLRNLILFWNIEDIINYYLMVITLIAYKSTRFLFTSIQFKEKIFRLIISLMSYNDRNRTRILKISSWIDWSFIFVWRLLKRKQFELS